MNTIPAMINPKDGSVNFDMPKIRFYRGMLLKQFTDCPSFCLFALRTDLDPSMTYSFRDFHVGDVTFDGTVWFYSGVILRLEFVITNPPPSQIEAGWYRHRNYLGEIFGHRYDEERDGSCLTFTFPWGSVAAGEVKGSEAGICVSYDA
jgi:hypothetical protein